MKKFTIITFILLFGIIGNNTIKAQGEDLYSAMAEYLSTEENEQMDKAKENFAKGDKLEDQIRQEDTQNQKVLSKKGKKTEKKTVEAKALRVKQVQYYEKGFDLIYNVYSEKVSACVFSYPEDETKVNELNEDAATQNASAKRKMKELKSLNEKDLKKKVEYAKLKSDIQNTISSYTKSIKSLIDAYQIFLDEESKKQLEEEENRVWQNALSENSILSFQSYLSDYPNGKYASEAQSQISALEEKARKEKEDVSRSIQSNLTFQVQIAASKVKLSMNKISTFYKATKEVVEKNYDGWYKYSVGTFKTYTEAKNMLPRVKVKGAFVVAYDANNKKVEIVESMKTQK